MAKRKRTTTTATIEKRLKEGRGQGAGKNYIPWLLIHDVPSTGRATRLKGWKTGRIHHLMSDLERDYFYVLEWSDDVSDIREQFPLLPLEETLEIAEELGIPHPVDPRTKEPIVLTTDFYIMAQQEFARTVKMSSELESERVLEKFEIERRYWKRRGVDWGIVTENEIPGKLVWNVEWIHSEHENEDAAHLGTYALNNIENSILSLLKQGISLAKAASLCDERVGLELGTSLALVKHFIARKRWIVDMYEKINPGKPLEILEVRSGNDLLLARGDGA